MISTTNTSRSHKNGWVILIKPKKTQRCLIEISSTQDLVDPSISWNHRAISTKIQWNAPGIAFMLNIDVALYIDIQVPPSQCFGHFTIENFRLMLRVRAPATSQLAKNLLLPLLLRHLLQAMRCFFCLMYCHLLSLCFHIIESSVRCGYLPSQRCSQKCWLMDLQSSMILKMLESSIFLLTIFIYSILTIYSARLCSLNTRKSLASPFWKHSFNGATPFHRKTWI